MSSDIPTASPRNCFLAQTTPHILGNDSMNPDVGGFAIGITTIVYNICVSIIVALLAHPQPQPQANDREARDGDEETVLLSNGRRRPSPTEDLNSVHESQTSIFSGPLQASIIGLFSLNHAILLSALSTIGRPEAKLSLFEAHFAVAVTASPVTVYLIYKAYEEVFLLVTMLVTTRPPPEGDTMMLALNDIGPTVKPNVKTVTDNAKKGVAKFTTYVVVVLAALLPVSWMMLNLVVSYSTTAFRNSYYCRNLPLGSWFEYQVLSNFVGVLDVMGRRDLWNDVESRKGLGIVSLVALWMWGILFVHHRRDIWIKIQLRRRTYRHWWWPFRYLRHLWTFVKTPWTGIARSHPWHFLLIICCFHWSWVLGIYRGIERDSSYEFTFGQALSVFSTILPVLALCGVGMSSITKIKGWTWGAIWKKSKDEASFLLTRKPNPWWPESEPPVVPRQRLPRLRTAILFFLVLIMNGGFVVWVYYYVQAGTKPNIRTPANNPHKNWKFFSVCLYVYSFLLGCVNVEASFWLSSFKLDEEWLKLARIFYRACLLLLAFFLCAAPLFSPFLALALAQEYQWRNGCSSFPGRVNLEGGAHIKKPPEAYIHLGGNIQLDYILTQRNGSDSNLWTFDLQNTTAEVIALADFSVIVQSVSYDMNKNTTSARCLAPNMSTATHCMWGHFVLDDHFAFFLNDTRTDTQIELWAQDKEWSYSDDAPSFRLNYVESGRGRVMETAVTKRSHCESLLVCLGSNRPGLETLAPLGLALWAEDAFASYCTTTGLVI